MLVENETSGSWCMSTVKSTNFTVNMRHRSHYDLWPPIFFFPLCFHLPYIITGYPPVNHPADSAPSLFPLSYLLSLISWLKIWAGCIWGWIQWIHLIIFSIFFIVRGRKATYVICHPQILSAMPLCYLPIHSLANPFWDQETTGALSLCSCTLHIKISYVFYLVVSQQHIHTINNVLQIPCKWNKEKCMVQLLAKNIWGIKFGP